jgi:hypothetical protein
MSHYCEALVSDLDFDPAHETECGEPATVAHCGVWFCEYHYDLFFADEDALLSEDNRAQRGLSH